MKKNYIIGMVFILFLIPFINAYDTVPAGYTHWYKLKIMLMMKLEL